MRRSALSPARQRFVSLLHEIAFGRVEKIRLHEGDPVLGPETRIVRTISLNGESQREPFAGDFELKRPVIQMLAEFDRISTGVIERIDVKAGLPCFIQLVEVERAEAE